VKALLAALLTLAALAVAQADEIVTAVQSRLAKLGYYAGEVDGEWGSQTAAAVRRFQVAKELRVTGELNAATLNALGVKAPPPVPNARAVALADLFVKKAQQNLKLLGFYGGSANGAPDAALTDALRAYQKAHRFKASGRLDKTTLQALDLLTLPPED
jgi:peptidoglycan hydrolase-like protein with peptidoglycan-binding domain